VSGGEEVFRHCALTRVKQRCQVLVVGGGPAGLSAALGE
jgi:NADPH-dependent 2,4-dienoyl-CoA reductase/sulfur reductase-like enzyme